MLLLPIKNSKFERNYFNQKNLVHPTIQTMNPFFKITSVFIIFLFAIGCEEKAETPVLADSWLEEIGPDYAVVNAFIASDGGAPVKTRGVCWNTSPDPKITDNKTFENGETGGFSIRIEPLEQKTLYYIKAFATNSAGVGYGYENEFTTYEFQLFIETKSVTDITAGSATSGGIVRRGMGMEIEGLGLCWSTHPEATTDDNKTVDGTVMKNFSGSITGLNAGTKYYIRTYVISSTGTIFYGNENSFITLNQ